MDALNDGRPPHGTLTVSTSFVGDPTNLLLGLVGSASATLGLTLDC